MNRLLSHSSRRAFFRVAASRWLAATALTPLVVSLAACRPSASDTVIPAGATVLAFGDSITHGTGAGPGEDWPSLLAMKTGWRLINEGVPGDTAQAGKGRIGPLLSQHQPALVIVGLGGNDFLRRRQPAQVKEDLRDILRQIKSSGAKVVILGVPSPSLLGVAAGRLSDDLLYRQLSREEGVVLVAGVISKVLSNSSLIADPIHPNAEGYRMMALAIYRSLQDAGLAAR